MFGAYKKDPLIVGPDQYIDILQTTLKTVLKDNENLVSKNNALNELLDAVKLERDDALIALGRTVINAI